MMNIEIPSLPICKMFLLVAILNFALSRWEVWNPEIFLVPGLMPATELNIQYGSLRQNITRIDKVSNLYLFFMM